MMSHPLVTQLRFARSEFQRCLSGVSPDDAVRHLGQMNCLSWIVGHLASQEQYLWVIVPGGKPVAPELSAVAYGKPASAPGWDEMWSAWRAVTEAADTYLDEVTSELLDAHPTFQNRALDETTGTLLLRNIYHYWFHTGEAHAIRQQLGHPDLPQFVGDMQDVRYQT
jgi:uncharacterized damage-inducible protein DinB